MRSLHICGNQQLLHCYGFNIYFCHAPLFFFPPLQISLYQTVIHSQPTEQLPILSSLYTLLSILLFFILSVWPNHCRTHYHQSFHPPSSCRTILTHDFDILSILFIPHKLLRLSICAALILDLSLLLHTSVSLLYTETSTSMPFIQYLCILKS